MVLPGRFASAGSGGFTDLGALGRNASKQASSGPSPFRGATQARRAPLTAAAALAGAPRVSSAYQQDAVQQLHPSTSVALSGPEAQRRSSNGQASSSGGASNAGPRPTVAALPMELQQLTDPDASVVLPSPDTINTANMDNRDLDKLVCLLGRCKATWRRALMLYEWLQQAGHPLDDRLCTTLIRVCAEHGQAAQALGIYEWMRAPRSAGGPALHPTVFTYTAAMRAALGAGMLQRAMQVWHDAVSARCAPDCRLAITYIETCSRMGDVDGALAMYAQMRAAAPGSRLAPSVHAFTAAMRAASEGGRWQKALEVWSDMRAARVPPTGHAYAAAISACATGGDWARAVSLFEDMCSDGIRPDVVSCTALISALAAGGQWARAESVVGWMLSCGLKPNVRTYTALISALASARQWERALDVLARMRTPAWGSIAPNAYTYSALLKSMGEHGQWALAESVFSEVEAAVLGAPAVPVVSAVADAAAAAGLKTSFVAQLRPAQQLQAAKAAAAGAGLQPPSGGSSTAEHLSTWESASQLNGLDLGLGLQAASQPPSVQASVPASINSGVQSHRSSSSSIGALAAAHGVPVGDAPLQALSGSELLAQQLEQHVGLQEAADRAAEQYLEQQLPKLQQLQAAAVAGGDSAPSQAAGDAAVQHAADDKHGKHQQSRDRVQAPLVNEAVCGALMLAYERAGKWLEAVGVLHRARALGIQPNTVMYNTAISAAGKAGQVAAAEALFAQVPEPNGVTFETMVAAYGITGDPLRAEAVFTALVSAGHRPRDYAFCGLVAAYSLAGDVGSALRVRHRMRLAGAPPTVHVYNALVAACERAGQYEKALDLLRSMKRDGVEANAVTGALMASIGAKGAASVENQQLTAAALSAAMAAAGTLLIRTGMF